MGHYAKSLGLREPPKAFTKQFSVPKAPLPNNRLTYTDRYNIFLAKFGILFFFLEISNRFFKFFWLFSHFQNEAETGSIGKKCEKEWYETAGRHFTQIRLEIDKFVDIGIRQWHASVQKTEKQIDSCLLDTID